MGIVATIGAIATALTALSGLINLLVRAFTPSQAETDQGIDQQEEQNKQQAEHGGRPV